MHRRGFVGALGVAVSAAVAGCSDGGGSSGPTIERPESHAQDMTMVVTEEGAAVAEQQVHLEIDEPDFLMEFSTSVPGGGAALFNGRFVKVDGTTYLQIGGYFCQEYGQSDSEVQAMAATPERFEGNGALEETGIETIDGTEVEVWEADVDDVPVDQLSFQPDGVSAGSGDFGGQFPGGDQSSEQPAYLDPDGVEDGSLTLWIGADDRYLYRAEQTATFSADDAEFGFKMTAENYDFGESFDVEAPSNCGGSNGSAGSDGGDFGDGFGG